MLTALLAIISLASPNSQNPHWVDEMLKSHSIPIGHKDASSHGNRTTSSSRNNPTATVRINDHREPPLDPAEKAAKRAYEAMDRRVAKLIEEGRYETAYRESLELHAEKRVTTGGDPLIHAGLLAGHYREVESLLLDYEKRHGNEDGGAYWINLSIASALRGKVYQGQGAFAVETLRGALNRIGWEAIVYDSQPTPSLPKSVAFASVLAAGFQSAMPYSAAYLEWSLRLDPKCEVAAKRLVDEYESGRRYADAFRVASVMVRTLPAGAARDAYREKVGMFQGKKSQLLPSRRPSLGPDI